MILFFSLTPHVNNPVDSTFTIYSRSDRSQYLHSHHPDLKPLASFIDFCNHFRLALPASSLAFLPTVASLLFFESYLRAFIVAFPTVWKTLFHNVLIAPSLICSSLLLTKACSIYSVFFF